MVTTELTEASTSRFTKVGDINVHYNEAGSGNTLIMMHGGGPGAGGWSNFRKNIGPLSESYHVMLVDEIGFGQTDHMPPTEPYSQMNARMLRDLLDTLKIDKTHLIGNSAGGAISLNFSIDYPDRVDHLVMMGAAGGGTALFMPTPSEGIKLLIKSRQGITRDLMRDFIKLMVYDSSFLTEALLDERMEAATKNWRPPSPTPAPTRDLHFELDKVRAKTLITWGADDRFVSLDQGLRFMRGIKGAQLHVFADCGHWAQWEHPEQFNALMQLFLTS